MKTENDNRIEAILKDKWVNYPKSKQVMDSLEMLLKFPKNYRMQNLLIMGESNNGKTTIARRFLNQHKPYIETLIDKETSSPYESVVRPVIMIQCPHVPHEKSFYYNVLDQLNLPYRKNTRAEFLKQTIINAFKDMKVKIMIMDEIHHVLSGTASKQREFLNLIKYISNEAQVSIVALGTSEASFALKAERQLDTRFDKMIIPKWQYDENFLKLLLTIEKIIALKNQSNLVSPDISKLIFQMSNGIIGEVFKIVRLASLKAIETGEERITLKGLKDLDYVSPFDNNINYIS